MSERRLHELLGAELDRPVPDSARALAAHLANRGGAAAAVVLFYGSALRSGNLDGILDFYVLLDDIGAWPAPLLARAGNRLLPPNVGYVELDHAGQRLRAKFAVMGSAQFAARLTDAALDTTIWARFCQPAVCIWSRSPADRAAATDLIAAAVVRAARWAARLGPARATPAEFWSALFARTYAAELRVEQAARPQDIIARDLGRYEELLPLAWAADALAFARMGGGQLQPALTHTDQMLAKRGWRRRTRHGRRLNLLRLLKAAFTFEGAMDYVAWKIERHRGVRIEVKPWQRRFPLLAAPGLYWKLRRLGVISRRA